MHYIGKGMCSIELFIQNYEFAFYKNTKYCNQLIVYLYDKEMLPHHYLDHKQNSNLQKSRLERVTR